jgi:hypothetical protein
MRTFEDYIEWLKEDYKFKETELDINDLRLAWDMGYNTGLEKSESEAETLRDLLAANVRVIKEELRKEMQEELDNNNKED